MAPTGNYATIDQSEYWKRLESGAAAGDLKVSPEVARACNSACAAYISALDHQLERVKHLVIVDGMGQLPSGLQLADKFSKKAIGGELSLEDVLRQHIAVIQAMQAFFRRFFTDVDNQDADTARLLTDLGPR